MLGVPARQFYPVDIIPILGNKIWNNLYIFTLMYYVHVTLIEQKVLIKLLVQSSYAVFSYQQQHILNVVENFGKIIKW